MQRKLAHRVRVLAPGEDGYCEPSCSRAHRLAATAVCLTSDDATAFTVSKDGGICRWDVETGKRTHLYRCGAGTAGDRAGGDARGVEGRREGRGAGREEKGVTWMIWGAAWNDGAAGNAAWRPRMRSRRPYA